MAPERPPSVPRPATPAGFDASRAAERAAEPAGWRLSEAAREGLWDALLARRDVRRFRPDPVPEAALTTLLTAAHHAPSVGYSQPWRFVIARSASQRAAVHALADRERLRQGARFGTRSTHFLEQKVEGIREAPLGVLVCCDHGDPETEVLGRGTIPETLSYSTACAVQNLWLAARAEGLGVGWVSFYEPADMRAVFGLPERVEPLAYLCVGYPDERPVRPGLESAGWAGRTPLELLVHEERWDPEQADAIPAAPSVDVPTPIAAPPLPEDPPAAEPSVAALLAAVPSGNHAAALTVRDRADRLLKPVGSLGALERTLERWAASSGDVPPVPLRAGILVCCGDHGVAARGTTLWGSEVSALIARAAVRGETAIGVLARHGGHRLIVADLGLHGEPAPELRAARVVAGTRDLTIDAALTTEELVAAFGHGATLAAELLDGPEGAPCLVLGEIGMGNTTAAAALAAALLGLRPEEAVGRGAGADPKGLAVKQAAVGAALARHTDRPRGPLELLRRLGGAELAALAGAMLTAAARRRPVLLDGFAVGVVALAATRACPALRDHLFAAHRSTEPAHAAVLTELGLEPLLDLRLRLGEASGAALALPLLEQAAALHRGMGTFAEAGVEPAG